MATISNNTRNHDEPNTSVRIKLFIPCIRFLEQWRRLLPPLTLGGVTIGYTILFVHRAFYSYDHFSLTAYDLGIFDQAVWLISRFHFPFVTVRGLPLLADHFSLILYFIAPLYWIWDNPRTLVVLQTVVLALGALPIYALAVKKMGSGWYGLLFGFIYLLNPAMQWTNTFDFHPETLATPILLAAYWFLLNRKWGWYFVMLAMTAMTKETAALAILFLGLYVLFFDRKMGWITMAFGMAAFIVSMMTIRFYNHGAPSAYLSLYTQYGGTPIAIAIYLLAHPLWIITALLNGTSLSYYFQLLEPLLFLPLFAPEVMLIATPSLLVNLLSSRPATHMIYFQYTTYITPFWVVAAVIGFDRLRRHGNRFTTAMLTVNVTIAGTIGCFWLGPLMRHPLVFPAPAPTSREAVLMLRQIPSAASVSVQTGLVPHLDHRLHIYTFPNPFYRVAWGNSAAALEQEDGKDYSPCPPKQLLRAIATSPVQYVMLLTSGSIFPLTPPDRYCYFAVAVLRSPDYGVVDGGYGAILLRRGADHRRGLALLARRLGASKIDDKNVGVVFRELIAGSP